MREPGVQRQVIQTKDYLWGLKSIDMKYAELYEYGKKTLEDAGIQEASIDARLLLEFATGADRTLLYAHPETEVEEQKKADFESFLAKRAGRMPLQHITRRQSFMGLTFLVNENVLIPRQDTEILVEEVMREPFDGCRILDICSGSGCILLSLLRYSNDTTGVGLDISEKAVEIAKENAKLLEFEEDRVSFLKSDLLEKAEGIFDIVVANPPYIKTDVIETLMPEVREHEPILALDGGGDGLLFYKKILKDLPPYVRKGTRIYFEIGYDQGQEVKALMEEAGISCVEIIKDYAGLDRVVFGEY